MRIGFWLVVLMAMTALCSPRSFAQALDESSYQRRGSAAFDEAVITYLRNEAPKIIGGTPAQPGAYPWQASLVVSWISDPSSAHFCGGSVIRDRWILTAAHCLVGVSPADVHVIVGTNKLTPGTVRNDVRRRIVHGAYKDAEKGDDIALVELRRPLTLGKSISAIDLLPASGEPQVLVKSQKLWVTGWGATKEEGNVVKDLRQVSVPYVTNESCK
jgi:secreted trypsin-like serine protease